MGVSESDFWSAIEESLADSDGDPEAQLEHLRHCLESHSREDVLEFQRRLNEVMARAYTWNLIGAACFLGCGQSDDGFEDFRAWLVSLGEATFERVLADVNELTELHYDESPTEEWCFEELHLLPGEVGGEEEDVHWPYRKDPETPLGEPAELTQQALKRRVPLLWEHFGNEFMIGIE